MDTPAVVAGFAGPESVDTPAVVAGFGGHTSGRPPRARTATPAAFRYALAVSRRTAFVRNNGLKDQVPSFTIISNRCVHLGCPTQPQGPPGELRDIETSQTPVTLSATTPSGFGCPCHGGAYDVEGNRTAGPPVRALDRYEYSIRNGNVWLETPYSVASVEGTSAEARIRKYRAADPGVHVDGPEQYLYPYAP